MNILLNGKRQEPSINHEAIHGQFQENIDDINCSMNGLRNKIINLNNIIKRLQDKSQRLRVKCSKQRKEYR